MMNVLLVSSQTEQAKGGIAVWTDTYLAHCERYGIACDLLNIAMIGARAQKGNSKRNFADEFVRSRQIFRNLKTMLSEKAYDAAHVNTSCAAFGLIRDYLTVRKLKKKQPHCRAVVHFHCDVEMQLGTSGYKRYVLKKLLRAADSAVVLNENNRRFLETSFGVKGDVAANFVDEMWLRTEAKPISARIERAAFVGFVQPQKGVRELYDLALAFPQITFDLIGEVRADVKEWDKPANIRLCGTKKREDMAAALDPADVFVFPTHSEGFSVALLESMARGLPCLTTTVGANADMLENRGGMLTEVGDTKAMIAALERMQDPQLREEMSAWNIQKVRTAYMTDVTMMKFKQIYQQDVGER